jgi:hypothetical protein
MASVGRVSDVGCVTGGGRRRSAQWLQAGVREDGCVSDPEAGAPQGGVASPRLSNGFLHDVRERWVEQDGQPGVRQRAVLGR